MATETILQIPVVATQVNDTDLFEKADGPTSGQSQQVTALLIKSYVQTASGLQGGSGNYAGGQPSFTPAAGLLGIAVDTSNGRLWLYYGGAWN